MATPIDSKKTVYTSETAYKSPHFFQSLPRELFLKVLSLLKMQDIQELIKLDRWMFTEIMQQDIPEVVKEILFRSLRKEQTQIILDPKTRYFFGIDHRAILSMRPSEIQHVFYKTSDRLSKMDMNRLTDQECVLVFKSSSTHLIERFIASKRFIGLDRASLADAFQWIGLHGKIEHFHLFIRSKRFIDIHSTLLSRIFSWGREKGQNEIIKAIMLSPRFSDVSIDSIILAFLNACIYDDVDTVFHLLSCHRFREIPGTILGDALQVACKHKKHPIISIIIDSKLSDSIPQEKVYAAMTEAVKLGELKLVTLLQERFSSQNVRIECVLC